MLEGNGEDLCVSASGESQDFSGIPHNGDEKTFGKALQALPCNTAGHDKGGHAELDEVSVWTSKHHAGGQQQLCPAMGKYLPMDDVLRLSLALIPAFV
ncbi:unnamed protein product [Notodromas monacha]|uniref:Uncharacterized protein n=1 Tax=Notodromas monacha TaxID=399045 RepID=A0A7R9BT83_9CRUS|nr:unnamed protein product [Notodromas monacha]CAG0920254.1 unnamed protein product [Notodromas monacha]